MSLVVALATKNILCVAADTRAYSINDGPLDEPVEIIRLFLTKTKPILVSLAGESEINGTHLFKHLELHLEKLDNQENFHQFMNYLKTEWNKDVESFPWTSPTDKSNYLSNARIDILIAISFDSLFIISGTYHKLDLTLNSPPKTILAFGRPDLVKNYLDGYENNPLDPSQWNGYLTTLFQHASSQCNFVAPPIDLAWWKNNEPPRLTRVGIENQQ